MPGQRMVAMVSGHSGGCSTRKRRSSSSCSLVRHNRRRAIGRRAPGLSASVGRGSRRLVVTSGSSPSSRSTATRSSWVGTVRTFEIPEVAPGPRPGRHRVHGRQLDDDRQTGVVGQRPQERGRCRRRRRKRDDRPRGRPTGCVPPPSGQSPCTVRRATPTAAAPATKRSSIAPLPIDPDQLRCRRDERER